MSNKPSPGTLIEENDPIVLKAMLDAKRREFAQRPAFAPNPALSEAENAAEQMAYDAETARLTNEQIGIVMKIRGITSLPKKRATSSHKKPPIDFDSLEADIMSLS
jgi:hypothetical protein